MYTRAVIVGTVVKVLPVETFKTDKGDADEVLFFIEAENRRSGATPVVSVCVVARYKLANVVANNVGVGSTVIVDGDLLDVAYDESGSPHTCVGAIGVTFLNLVRPERNKQPARQAPTLPALPTPSEIDNVF